MVISSCIHVAVHGIISLFSWLNCVALYICIFFIYSSVNGHLGCFHVLIIVSGAAVNIGVSELYFCLNICAGVGLLEKI